MNSNFSNRRPSLQRLATKKRGKSPDWASHKPLHEVLEQRRMLSGWTNLSASGSGPSFGQTTMLLSDGTVMVESAAPQVNTNWFQLTPGQSGNSFPGTANPTGNYVSGNWSSLASMNEGRAFFPSAMLPNGQVFVVGGEYSSPDPFTNTAEIFNPTSGATGSWSYVAPAPTPSTNVGLNAKITGASNTSPITLTTTNTGVLSPGEQVTVSGVLGNTAANGTWNIANITPTSFQLVGSSGNGAYTSGGNWNAFQPQFGDDPIEVLGNGNVLAGYFNSPATYLYNPTTNSWTTTGTKLHNDRSDEETWLKLPGGDILSYDVFSSMSGTFQAQFYDPTTGIWHDASNLDSSNPPSILSDSSSAPNGGEGAELGPAFLLPNGNAIFFGANGNTAIYNPTTNLWSAGPAEPTKPFSNSIGGATNASPIVISTPSTAGLQNGEAVTISGVVGNTAANGTWVISNLSGTSFQLVGSTGNGSYVSGGTWSVSQLVMADAPGAIMPNGDILLVMSPLGGNGANGNYTFPATAYAYEFNPTTGVYTEVTPGGGLPSNSNFYYMLTLPSGEVLMDGNDGTAAVYTPAGTPLDAWRPVITGIANNHDGTFTLRGTQLNGISEGANFGDDVEEASNYPIVQFTDFGGNVFYARTFNWSSTGVQTGSTPESATFTLPPGKSLSDFATVTVVANGIPSLAANIVNIDTSDENLVIRVDPSDSTNIQVLVDGTGQVVANFPNNSANPIQVFGDGNNNRLVVDETYGNVNTPINFDGGGSTGAAGDRMLVVGSSGNDSLVVTPVTPTSSTMSFNGSAVYSFTNIQQFGYYGAGGNDNMTVDSSTSLSSVPMLYDGDNGFTLGGLNDEGEGFGIQLGSFSGGNGFNTLNLIQTGGSQTSDTYSVGPNNGEGHDVISGGGITQSIDFENLAPVIDTVPVINYIVNATPSNNAINYANANDGATGNGLITIDNQESVEFANKTNLILNGQAGDDTTNLNYQPTTLGVGPQSPAGLTSITVDSGDPTGSDDLIVNGIGGVRDGLIVTPTGTGAGTITDPGVGAFVPLTFANTENLSMVGQTADNDALAYLGTAGNDTFEFTPGATPDSGTVTGFESGVFTFTPLQFSGFAGTAATPSVVSLDSGGGLGGPTGGVDTVIVDGAAGGNTTFSQSAIFLAFPAVQLNGNGPFVDLDPTVVSTLRMRGIGPNNTFNTNVSNTTATPAGLTIQVQGTGATASEDVLNYTAASGAATTISYATSTITQTGPAASPVQFSGVGIINETSSGAGSTLTIIGAAKASTLNYTPADATSGMVTLTGANPVINFTGVGSTFTLNGAAAGANQAYVYGTALNDTFLIDEPTRTVTVNAFKAVVLGANIASLSAFGVDGDDTFTVNPAPFSVVSAGGLPVNIDGGDPEASDALIVNAAAATQFTVVNQGRTPNTGTVRVYDSAVADPDISYKNVEIVDPNTLIPPGSFNAPNLLIMGPDNYEANNFLNNSYFLGSGSTLQIQHASIFPNFSENGNNPGVPADQDYYHVVAQQTGTLDFQVYFQLFSKTLLPGGGNLNVQVLNAAGQILGSSTGAFGADSTLASPAPTGARVRIPAVAGQSYYLRITGGLNVDGLPDPTIVNGYDATVINTPSPVPYNIELSRSVPPPIAGNPDTGDLPPNAPADDTGRSQFDNVTNINNPTLYVHVDDAVLLQDLQGNQANNSPPIGQIPIPFNTSTTLVPVGTGYRVALYDDGGGHTVDPNDPTFLGFAQMVTSPAGYPHLYALNLATVLPAGQTLSDGIHNITAKVQMIDPANPALTGLGSRSVALAITIDTAIPPIQFGITSPSGTSTGLDGASDSGVAGIGVLPDPPPTTPSETTVTLSDKITNVEEPTFYGTTEANAIVKLFAIDKNGNPVQLGQTQAVPIDGTNADPTGQWTITSTVDLNDPKFFTFDGIRHLYVTAQDLAGNTNSNGVGTPPAVNAQQLDIFLDTTGPQVTGVNITQDPAFNLFGLKSNNNAQGPTPLVNSIDINIQDLPPQDAAFLREAIIVGIAQTPGGIELVGDSNGVIPIKSITVIPPAGAVVTPLAPGGLVPAGSIPTDTVRITFFTPLPDDRFTLTIHDTAIVDVAGNDLDGESNAVEPDGAPHFPSGDGQPGGDFVARFTVDSRPEIGTYAAGSVWLDINGNQTWDPANTDFTNRDLILTLGITNLPGVSPYGIHDALNAGDFLSPAQIALNNPPAPGVPAQPLPGQQKIGYDKLVAYGFDALQNSFRWLIDTNSDGIIDPAAGDYEFAMASTSQINGVPVVGDFALSPSSGDQIGLFDGTTWYLGTSTTLTNFANAKQAGNSLQFSSPFLKGAPVVGDFNGAVAPNGAPIPDLATYLNGVFHIVFGQIIAGQLAFVDTPANEATVDMTFAGVGGIPLASDMNGDGFTDLGVYEPRTTGITPQTSEWYWLISNPAANPGHLPNAAALNHPFSPTPLGNDIFADFGEQTALPVVGNFDPPVQPAASGPSITPVGPVLGSASVTGQTISGANWYSFTPLRSGTMTVTANGATGVGLYDANQDPINAGGSSSVTNAVVAGTQYLVKVGGNASGITVSFANQIDLQTLLDVNGDGVITPLDALAIINNLNSQGAHQLALIAGSPELDYDTNLDGMISPLDALLVINALNSADASRAGSAVASRAVASPAVTSAAAAAPSAPVASDNSVNPAVAAGGMPAIVSTPSAGILAVDAVFAGLASSSEPTTATNLQSKGATATLSMGSQIVRKANNNSTGSPGIDPV